VSPASARRRRKSGAHAIVMQKKKLGSAQMRAGLDLAGKAWSGLPIRGRRGVGSCMRRPTRGRKGRGRAANLCHAGSTPKSSAHRPVPVSIRGAAKSKIGNTGYGGHSGPPAVFGSSARVSSSQLRRRAGGRPIQARHAARFRLQWRQVSWRSGSRARAAPGWTGPAAVQRPLWAARAGAVGEVDGVGGGALRKAAAPS